MNVRLPATAGNRIFWQWLVVLGVLLLPFVIVFARVEISPQGIGTAAMVRNKIAQEEAKTLAGVRVSSQSAKAPVR